jgi:hypothetical protein
METLFTSYSIYPLQTPTFFRITHSQSLIPFSPASGFKTTHASECLLPLNQRLNRYVLICHLGLSPECEWSPYISVYATEEKALLEIDRRLSEGGRNVVRYEVDTGGLKWITLRTEDCIAFNVLIREDRDALVLFVSAREVIWKFGLVGELSPAVARDEWLALEWIPRDMVIGWEECSWLGAHGISVIWSGLGDGSSRCHVGGLGRRE